jgi:hypothetical protein
MKRPAERDWVSFCDYMDWCEAEIARLKAVVQKIAHIAGEFSPEHADPATALLACEQEAQRALEPRGL